MKLTLEGIKDRKVWEEAGISLPSYDVEAVAEATREKPVWVHFGAGNIFRIFIGGIADVLISEGMSGKGITCAETFDFDVIEKIYKPYDNLVLGVTLKADGSTDKKVIGSLTEALKAQAGETRDWKRLKDIFADPGLQIASFTITEKGYALKGADGAYFPFIQADIDNGPENAISAMAVMCSLLYERYKAGKAPLAVVSMDNCSHNGEKLQESVTTMAKEWNTRWGERLLDTSIQMLRNVPHLALIPLVILWFGIDETAKIFLVSLGTLFPIYINTWHGIRNIDRGLVEMARSYGLSGFALFRHVILPGALPSVMVGVRFALGLMWLTLIVAETISANAGIWR